MNEKEAETFARFLQKHLRLSRSYDYDGETMIELGFAWQDELGTETYVLIDKVGLGDQDE